MPLTNSFDSNWICFQIGAREHYAIPIVLEQKQNLSCLVTDAWIAPQSLLNLLPKPLLSNLRERYHPQLDNASVRSFNFSLGKFEIEQKLKQKSSWQTIINRNQWFQNKSLKLLQNFARNINEPITIFSYSYAALEIFKFAKKQGWRTVLGQIDPGIYEEKIVARECSLYPQYASNWQPAPSQYWSDWQQECDLADSIIVNSEWSNRALQKIGIENSKIEVVPLAYKPSQNNNYSKNHPKSFSTKRPLKVLFLGQIILRKGLARIIEAIELLKNEAIEFWFVGSTNIDLPQTIKNNSKVKWFGSVSRSTTANYYQQADVFLFPTLSDGFGLTQLEARAWQLPIIASQNCGAVVKDKINGLILPELTPNAIADALRFCLQNPLQLQKFASQSCIDSEFSLHNLSNRLQAIAHGYI